jgi:hypothetical protein
MPAELPTPPPDVPPLLEDPALWANAGADEHATTANAITISFGK